MIDRLGRCLRLAELLKVEGWRDPAFASLAASLRAECHRLTASTSTHNALAEVLAGDEERAFNRQALFEGIAYQVAGGVESEFSPADVAAAQDRLDRLDASLADVDSVAGRVLDLAQQAERLLAVHGLSVEDDA